MDIVNELTGETSTLPELLASMRSTERAIQRLDDTICAFSAELKAAKQAREKAIAELRSIIREVKILERGPGRAVRKPSKAGGA
ncbi:MAG TPA: hypothetical protein VM364_07995 [Vicinamibacterales bacterium]|nr:hypothetical protein [Vicinamibacterales bacterium]